ncbi:MAG: hypothetical protein AAGA53_13960 [Pseudomonadota bacterium]
MLWEMSTSEWVTSLAFFASVTYLTGYFIDGILNKSGFGTFGNWMLILVGVYAGIYALNMYGYEMHWYPLITVCAIVGAASATLIVMCGLKRMFYL